MIDAKGDGKHGEAHRWQEQHEYERLKASKGHDARDDLIIIALPNGWMGGPMGCPAHRLSALANPHIDLLSNTTVLVPLALQIFDVSF